MSETEVIHETSGERPQETEQQREERLVKQQETDSRSIFVGNVDFKTTPEQLETFFNVCGVIERITILFDRYTGLPKGYAYIEFDSSESSEKAIRDIDGKEFRGRELKVTTKRTNLPRLSTRGRGRGGFRGRSNFRGRGDFRGRGRGRGRGNFRGRGGFRGERGGKSSSESDSDAKLDSDTKSDPTNGPSHPTTEANGDTKSE